jgi:ribosomal-protein-alanine N-acetyltransferase
VTERADTLRDATLAYAPLLAALHARSFAEAWGEEAMARLLASPGVSALLALTRQNEGEVPVGFILMRLAAEEAEILTVCVLPKERGKGIGGRLLEGALDALRAHGASAVFLEVGLLNAPARRLYERAGFVEIGRRRGYYRDPTGLDEDAVTLRRAL